MDIILLYGVFAFIIFLLICFPVGPAKSKHSTSTSRNVCPSDRANFMSKLFLSWFSSYVWENYKKPVQDNLWDVSEEESATYISAKFEKYLTRTSHKIQNDAEDENSSTNISDFPKSSKERISILKLLFKVYKFKFITSLLWKMLDTLLSMSYPIIFSILTSHMNEAESTWKLYACIIAFTVNATLAALVNARYVQDLGKLQQRISSILVSMIYKKILRTTDGSRRAYYTTGEMVNIMTIDVKKITESLLHIQYLLTAPFQFILAFYYLWKVVLGSCVVFNILMLIVILPINKYLIDAMMKEAKIETSHRNKRGKFVQDLLAGIKILKMYAWEANFEKKSCSLRMEETKHLRKSGHILDWLNFLYKCITPMMLFISFETYSYFTKQTVNVVQAFLSISFFNIFISSLNIASIKLSSIVQVPISIKRINDFLNLPELCENAISHDRISNIALAMKNATFSWTDAKESIVLRDTNLEIKKGALVTIVGPVGAGKSSLLSAFSGELQKISGYININGKIAYVPQQAWILNTTFKENVTLGAPVDESLYKNILEACSLDIDLQTFPANDFTEIGEKGINLSGGQKQRINIARAVCCNAHIYLFDDSMSAVDVHVAKHIFQHILGPNGILNQKTRVLVTHNTTFLAQSDFIIALKDGSIVESGTFRQLVEKNGYFSTLLAKYSHKVEAEDSNLLIEHCVDNVDQGIRKLCQKKIVSPSSNDAKLIEKEHIETVTVNREIFKYLLSIIGIWIAIIVLILDITGLVFSMSSRFWLVIWLTENNENDNSHSAQFYLLIYLALGLGDALFHMTSREVLLYGVIRASSLIYKKLLSSVLNWPLWLLDCTPVGRIINRAIVDVNTVDTILWKSIKSMMELCERFLVILLVTCYIEPISIAIFVVVLIIIYILQHQYHLLAYQLIRIKSKNSSPLSSHVVETMNGLASIRANRFQEKFISLLHEKIDLYSPTPLAIIISYKWCGIRMEILFGLSISLIIFLVLRQRNILGIVTVCFVISYTIQWTNDFQHFIIYMMELENSIISVERMKQYIDFPQENNVEKTCQVTQEWPTKGEIQFHKYKLRYRQNDNLVLKGLTFQVKSGEKIGIIGRTGAGKSSLILALMRLVEPADGTIFIDDVDIREVELRILRSRLTIIPQDSVSFLGTLRFNLDPTETCNDETLWNALEKSNLKSFVQQLPDGLQTMIEENGGNLSGGQKQLLCLARALIRKSQILILDEATASVDVQTDELIQKTIRREFSQSTVLTVAHRLNTIQDYDRILVMDDGKVMEFDTPDNLLRSKSSMFYTIMLKAGLIKE